jgi:hypothetical protein
VILEQADMVQRGFDERFGTGLAIFLQQVPLEAAGIDADPDRAAIGLGGVDHFPHAIGRADIAGIDAQACRARIGRFQRALVVKWMSATIGTRDARTICFSAAVDSASGQDTRMMSAPASSQRRIWSIVPRTSDVRVLVMVCTVTGASPPTGTEPTMIWREGRRAMSRHGRRDIRPI